MTNKVTPATLSFLHSASPSRSVSSLKPPHPHSPSPSLPPLSCSSHRLVATFVVCMNSWGINVPLWVNNRKCSVVSLAMPAFRLSSW